MQLFDQVLEAMPREKLRALQFQKLQTMLSQVMGRNRFYTKKWKDAGVVPEDIKSLSDFTKLPFTYKSELMKAQEDAPPFGTNATFPETAYKRVHQTYRLFGCRLCLVFAPKVVTANHRVQHCGRAFCQSIRNVIEEKNGAI
jgi:hypothetical protein